MDDRPELRRGYLAHPYVDGIVLPGRGPAAHPMVCSGEKIRPRSTSHHARRSVLSLFT